MPRPITARSIGLSLGRLEPGPLNSIADIAGVTVGHATRRAGEARTGVTVILPHQGNVFRDKVMAASHVINGFGKSVGLMQIDEEAGAAAESGSVIVVLATDVPVEHRQLRRVARRGAVGLCRVGSLLGHGSGDVVVAFTTANRIDHDEKRDLVTLGALNENRI